MERPKCDVSLMTPNTVLYENERLKAKNKMFLKRISKLDKRISQLRREARLLEFLLKRAMT